MIRAIVALDSKLGIGRAADLPWDIPDELRYFREKTEHHIVVMGAATYEPFATPLVNRRNIVVSRTLTDVRPGFELVKDLEAFLNSVTEDIWIIGGGQLYAEALPFCEELYVTRVQGDTNSDRFFPEFEQDYELVEKSEMHEQNGYKFRYEAYRRIKNR